MKRSLCTKRSIYYFSFFLVVIFKLMPAFAHSAHEHGAAKVDLAFDGLSGVIHFESPSSSIYGFEHDAKTAKDKKTRDEKINLLTQKFSEMVILDPKGGCDVTAKKIEPFVKEDDDHEHESEASSHQKERGAKTIHHEKKEGTHSEVHLEFTVTCKASLVGTSVKFAFQKFFPAIKKITVQAINGEKQNGATILNDQGGVGI